MRRRCVRLRILAVFSAGFVIVACAISMAIGSGVTTVVHTMRNPAMMRQSHEDFERLTAFVREWKA